MPYQLGVGRKRNLSALLEEILPHLWRLTVILGVHFEFVIHQEGDPDWSDSEKAAWVDECTERAEKTWSRRWHIAPGLVLGQGQPRVVDVEVVLNIRQIPDTELDTWDKQHSIGGLLNTMKVFHRCPHQINVPALTLDGRVVQVKQNGIDILPNKRGVLQRATDHEVGHLLGLKGHSVCEGNEDICYGEPGTPEGNDIMGLGMVVTMKDYEIFAEIMNRIRPDWLWSVQENQSVSPSKSVLMRIPSVGGGHRWAGRGWDAVVKRRKP
jgi:hypothetical protein